MDGYSARCAEEFRATFWRFIMRDNFSKRVIRVLSDRVNSLCSNPNCGASTRAPHSNSEQAINVGVAAHITAASVGGPRYDENLSPAERRHFTNGIWLCEGCSKLIDVDPDRFRSELLREWKSQAEQKAMCELGKPREISKGRIAVVSHLERFGAKTNVRVGDRVVPRAIVFDYADCEQSPTFYFGGAFVGRFKIRKSKRLRYAVLDEIRVTVYSREEIPPYRHLYGIYPSETSLYVVDIDLPAEGVPRTFSAERYYEVTETRKSKEERFVPLVLNDEIPHTVSLRINSKKAGLFALSVEVIVSWGMKQEIHTVMAPSHVIFE